MQWLFSGFSGHVIFAVQKWFDWRYVLFIIPEVGISDAELINW